MGRVVVCTLCFYGMLALINQTFAVNLSLSAPKGIWLKHSPREPLRVGDYVSFCPRQSALGQALVARGYVSKGGCSNGGLPLLKRVGAVAGDEVEVSAEGVHINGIPLEHSRSLVVDSKGRQLPQLRVRYTLGPGQLWVVSPQPRGLDSRYLGVLGREDVIHKVVPLWIYG